MPTLLVMAEDAAVVQIRTPALMPILWAGVIAAKRKPTILDPHRRLSWRRKQSLAAALS
jgi:hypothetical protein